MHTRVWVLLWPPESRSHALHDQMPSVPSGWSAWPSPWHPRHTLQWSAVSRHHRSGRRQRLTRAAERLSRAGGREGLLLPRLAQRGLPGHLACHHPSLHMSLSHPHPGQMPRPQGSSFLASTAAHKAPPGPGLLGAQGSPSCGLRAPTRPRGERLRVSYRVRLVSRPGWAGRATVGIFPGQTGVRITGRGHAGRQSGREAQSGAEG